MSKKGKILILIGAVLAVALILTLVFLWPGIARSMKITNENSAIRKAEGYFVSGDLNEVAKAVPILEKVLESPSSNAVEARAKVLLARTLLKAPNTDPLRAANLLKEASLREDYPLSYRIMALRYGADMCDKYGEQFIKENVVSYVIPTPSGISVNTNTCDLIRSYLDQLSRAAI